MRILANYGYKNNGDSYSVTFETVGDVPKAHTDRVVDELFLRAKKAIERQVKCKVKKEEPAVDIDDPFDFPPKVNGNSKPQLKDPEAPATPKQKSLIIRLAKEKGQFIENLNSYTMEMASQKIEELMAG